MGRKPRSLFDLMKPNIADRVHQNQQKQKLRHDRGTVQRSFKIGTPVFVKIFSSGPTWLAGEVTKTKGQCSYEVTLSDGCTIHHHHDHIRVRTVTTDQSTSMTDIDDPLMDPGVLLRQTAESR